MRGDVQNRAFFTGITSPVRAEGPRPPLGISRALRLWSTFLVRQKDDISVCLCSKLFFQPFDVVQRVLT